MGDNKELDYDNNDESIEASIRDTINEVLSGVYSGDNESNSEDVKTDSETSKEEKDENSKTLTEDAEVAKDKKKKLFGKKSKKSSNDESDSDDSKEDESDKKSSKKGKKSKKDKSDESSEKEAEAEEEDSIENYTVDEDGNFVKKKKRKKKNNKNARKPEDINIVKELLSLIIYFAIVILAVYFILTFVGCKSLVSGPSMNPTLQDMDQVWVDKLTYRFSEPKRFDVIIFNYDEDTTYVKRIIGLPGETVKIDTNGNIYINDKLMNENYGLERIAANKIGRASDKVYLGEGEYFVLGDNRNNSSDSRFADVGNVQKDDIVGKVLLRISPFKKFGLIK